MIGLFSKKSENFWLLTSVCLTIAQISLWRCASIGDWDADDDAEELVEEEELIVVVAW